MITILHYTLFLQFLYLDLSNRMATCVETLGWRVNYDFFIVFRIEAANCQELAVTVRNFKDYIQLDNLSKE